MESIKSGQLLKLTALPIGDQEFACDATIEAERGGDQFAIELFRKPVIIFGKGWLF